jgi:hypothetical protein
VELKGLLQTASAISSTPRISPSQSFRSLSQQRLMANLRKESQEKSKEVLRNSQIKLRSPRSGLFTGWQTLWRGLAARPLISVVLVILLVVGLWIFWPGRSIPVAAEYTLTILSAIPSAKSTTIQVVGE